MEDQRSPEAFENSQSKDKLTEAVDDFAKAYEGAKPGDPRLMALWDEGDRLTALANHESLVIKAQRGESTNQNLFLEKSIAKEVVINRVQMRSSETPGYMNALDELRELFTPVADTIAEKTRNNAAASDTDITAESGKVLSNLARTLAKKKD